MAEFLAERDSDLWSEGLQGGFGWYFVRARNQIAAAELLRSKMSELGQSLRDLANAFEIKSENDLESPEHLEIYRSLQTKNNLVEYGILHTYPFNSIE